MFTHNNSPFRDNFIFRIFEPLLQKMISIWSSGEETTRVLAFLCIIKLVRMQQENLLEPCLKVRWSD